MVKYGNNDVFVITDGYGRLMQSFKTETCLDYEYVSLWRRREAIKRQKLFCKANALRKRKQACMALVGALMGIVFMALYVVACTVDYYALYM